MSAFMCHLCGPKFGDSGVWPRASEESEAEVKSENPGQVACKRGQSEENGKQAQHGKQQHGGEKNAVFKGNLARSTRAGAPVATSYQETPAPLAQICRGPVGRRGTLAWAEKSRHGENRTRERQFPNQTSLWAALPVKADGD